MAQRAAHASTTPSTKEQTLQDTFKGLIIEDQWRFEGDTDKFHTFRTMIEAIANRYPIMAALLRNATVPTHTDMAAILRLDDAHHVATITAQLSSASCVDAPRCGNAMTPARPRASGVGKSQT